MRVSGMLALAMLLGSGCAAGRTGTPEPATLSLRVSGMVKSQGIT